MSYPPVIPYHQYFNAYPTIQYHQPPSAANGYGWHGNGFGWQLDPAAWRSPPLYPSLDEPAVEEKIESQKVEQVNAWTSICQSACYTCVPCPSSCVRICEPYASICRVCPIERKKSIKISAFPSGGVAGGSDGRSSRGSVSGRRSGSGKGVGGRRGRGGKGKGKRGKKGKKGAGTDENGEANGVGGTSGGGTGQGGYGGAGAGIPGGMGGGAGVNSWGAGGLGQRGGIGGGFGAGGMSNSGQPFGGGYGGGGGFAGGGGFGGGGGFRGGGGFGGGMLPPCHPAYASQYYSAMGSSCTPRNGWGGTENLSPSPMPGYGSQFSPPGYDVANSYQNQMNPQPRINSDTGRAEAYSSKPYDPCAYGSQPNSCAPPFGSENIQNRNCISENTCTAKRNVQNTADRNIYQSLCTPATQRMETPQLSGFPRNFNQNFYNSFAPQNNFSAAPQENFSYKVCSKCGNTYRPKSSKKSSGAAGMPMNCQLPPPCQNERLTNIYACMSL